MKKNQLLEKIVSYNNAESEFKAVSEEKEKAIKSNIKYRLVYLQEKIPDMRWYFISHKFFSVKYILV